MASGQLGIHAVALLNICDSSIRADQGTSDRTILGGLFGTPDKGNGGSVALAFELKWDEESKTIDPQFLAEKVGLLKTMNPKMQLIGWYTVGYVDIEDWMPHVHQQLNDYVLSPILGLFSIPEKPDTSEFPLKAFLKSETGWAAVPVVIEVERSEEIALNNVLSAESRSSGAIGEQLGKQSNALSLLQKRILVLRDYLMQAESGESVDSQLVAQIVAATNRLASVRKSTNPDIELAALTKTIVALIIKTDSVANDV